jgi:uncharacterized protein YggT (Ycf19 family)
MQAEEYIGDTAVQSRRSAFFLKWEYAILEHSSVGKPSLHLTSVTICKLICFRSLNIYCHTLLTWWRGGRELPLYRTVASCPDQSARLIRRTVLLRRIIGISEWR